MSNVTPRLAGLAFAGLLIWLSAFGAPATAAEAASARPGDIDACRIVAPRFEPTAPHNAPIAAVRFAGGAKLRFLVAAPCPRARPPLDV